MATENGIIPETLDNRAVIELRGDGVLSFLHNILTCGVESLNQGNLAYGALLSPQGKILHDLFIHHVGGTVFLDCAASEQDALIARLKLYRLRAKFEIMPRPDLHVEVGGDGASDPRLAALGNRALANRVVTTDAQRHKALRFGLGVAEGEEIGGGRFFPHEANFDQLHAVDFAKGCYIGQEVVSRMKHRSSTRSRIMPVTFDIDPPTDEIRNGDMLIGEIIARNGKQGLALLRLDRMLEHGLPEGMMAHKPDWIIL